MLGRFLLALSVGLINGQLTVRECSLGSSIFTINNLEVSPLYPLPNENATLYYAYTAPVEITSGLNTYLCTLNGLTVFDDSYSLCSGTTCPITIGKHDNTSIFVVPSVSGKLVCRTEWLSDKSDTLLCLEVIIKL
jgi:hypothetical protein